ncbi:MAG TPA: OsmC family peroxiredoxin, partial [Bdellovibrionales bacterium]|nr:OsmC family peroxiredoxin [Bdellovibrionales bacterium]
GNGSVSTKSGALDRLPYSFQTRFGEEAGTNPEELIAAAHASCFSMALSNELESRGARPERVDTSATVRLERDSKGWSIQSVHLNTRVKAQGVERAVFEEAARAAKENCPISRLLNTEITMDAELDAPQTEHSAAV